MSRQAGQGRAGHAHEGLASAQLQRTASFQERFKSILFVPLCRLLSIALLVTSSGFADDSSYLQEKCRRIKVPSVELEKTPFQEAIQYLQQRARELDEAEPDIQRKGVNIKN